MKCASLSLSLVEHWRWGRDLIAIEMSDILQEYFLFIVYCKT